MCRGERGTNHTCEVILAANTASGRASRSDANLQEIQEREKQVRNQEGGQSATSRLRETLRGDKESKTGLRGGGFLFEKRL